MTNDEQPTRDEVIAACEAFAKTYELTFTLTPADTLMFTTDIPGIEPFASRYVACMRLDMAHSMQMVHAWCAVTAKHVNHARVRAELERKEQ